ncbi:MAG TPA: hypothetical protein VGJ09_09665 [Bryobacteraceae bacterium]
MTAQTNNADWNVVKALASGTDVRITVGVHTVRGRILHATDEGLVLRSENSEEMFLRQEVTRVLLKGGSHRGRNSLIGLGGGAAVGAALGAATHQDCSGFCLFYTSRGTDAAIGAIVLGVIGAGVGALIPTRSWLEVYRQ